MRKEALVVIIIFVCVAIVIFSVAPNVSAEEDGVVAAIIDTTGSETGVYDLYLYCRVNRETHSNHLPHLM